MHLFTIRLTMLQYSKIITIKQWSSYARALLVSFDKSMWEQYACKTHNIMKNITILGQSEDQHIDPIFYP